MKILLSRSNKIGSLLIRLVTWSRFSHVGILTDCECYVIESLMFKGVVKTDINDFIERNSTVELAKMQGNQQVAAKYIGCGYDWPALIGIMTHRDWGKSDRWFCSELVAKASGMFRESRTGRITPEHIFMVSKHVKRLKG